MISKYAGKCKICSKPFKAGDEINYSKETGATHPECGQGDLLAESEANELADRLGFEPRPV